MEKKNLAILVGSIVVLVVSTFVMVRTFRPRGPGYNPKLDECLGEKMGDATVSLLHGEGAIVVISWAGSSADSKETQVQMKAFHRVLATHPGLQVVGNETPEGNEEAPGFGGIQKPLVERVMSKYPQAKALVSFLGVPVLNGGFGALDRSKLPAVVALSLGEFEKWQEMVSSGIPAAIVRNRLALQQGSQGPVQMPLAAQLCEDFVVVTSETAP